MNHKMLRALIAAGVGVAGCSGAGGVGDGVDLAMPLADLAEPPDLVPPYPVGPYGGEIGKVMPNYTFEGYWNPTATKGLATDPPSKFGTVTMEMMRNTGAKYGLVMLAGFW